MNKRVMTLALYAFLLGFLANSTLKLALMQDWATSAFGLVMCAWVFLWSVAVTRELSKKLDNPTP